MLISFKNILTEISTVMSDQISGHVMAQPDIKLTTNKRFLKSWKINILGLLGYRKNKPDGLITRRYEKKWPGEGRGWDKHVLSHNTVPNFKFISIQMPSCGWLFTFGFIYPLPFISHLLKSAKLFFRGNSVAFLRLRVLCPYFLVLLVAISCLLGSGYCSHASFTPGSNAFFDCNGFNSSTP